MSRRIAVTVSLTVFMVTAGLGSFLIIQGLERASLWAAILGLPLTAIGTAAGVWTALLTVRTLRGSREQAGAEPSGSDSSVVKQSGNIQQTSTEGITIGHTGDGDINITLNSP